MAEEDKEGLRTIRRALLSVSDKTGIVEFARELQRLGVEIISTGGTARALGDAGLKVKEISEVTGFPEMMDGRVKTLHPRIHGGLLALRDNPSHIAAMREHGIEPIDMVVVNLYPFEQTAMREGVTQAEAIEQIDIGGPAMIRSAAKNFRDVTVIVSPENYRQVIEEMQRTGGATSLERRSDLAAYAFRRTAVYDTFVAAYLSSAKNERPMTGIHAVTGGMGTGGIASAARSGGAGGGIVIPQPQAVEKSDSLPSYAQWTIQKASDLRYGENPHQRAALYHMSATGGVAQAELLSGKEMSFSNYVDADAAWQLVCDFDETACAIIKHTNPCGVGLGQSVAEAYKRALETDPVSAFGGIVAFNRTVDEGAARAVTEIFTEVVIAPDYTQEALEALKTKKNLRVLRAGTPERPSGLDYKQITGGMLVQTRDVHRLTRAELKIVTERAPTEEEVRAMMFAWTVCKHVKSNAIVYARESQTVGIGAGQMSRVDSVRIGALRAQLPLKGSVLASDAYFPFRDGIEEAAKHGITAVIQPGGSVRDEETIAAANEHGLAMVFTGVRHFRH